MPNKSHVKNWISDFDFLRPIVPFLIFGIAAFVVFSPFFLKGQLPLWSTDNLYGSYAPLVYSRENFWHGFCGWMPYSFCGMNFLSSVNNMTYSPLLMLVYLLPMKLFWSGLALLQFFCLWSIGYLAFLFIRRVLLHDGWALFAALIYQLNPQVLFSFQTFPMPILHVFFLAACYSIWTLGERPITKVISFIVITLSFSGLLLSGHLVYAAHFILVLFVFFFYRHGFRPREMLDFSRPTNVFILSLLTAVLICSIRWLPFVESLGDSSRIATNLMSNHREYLFRITRLFIPEVFGITNSSSGTLWAISGIAEYGGNQHEFFQYFGVLAIFFIILSFVKYGVRDNLFWKLLALFYAVMLLRIMPFAFLENVLFYPFLHGALIVGSTVSFSVLAGYAGKSLIDHLNIVGERHPSHTSARLDVLSVNNVMAWSLAILITVICYASMIWLPVWANSRWAISTAQLLLYSLLIFLISYYANRKNTELSKVLRASGLITLGVIFTVVVTISIAASFLGNGILYKLVWVNEMVSMGALFAVLLILIILRFNQHRSLAFVFFVFAIAMAIPWSGKVGSAMIADISFRDNFFIILLGLSRLLLIFSCLMLALFLYSRKKLTGGIFCVVCCLISFIDLSAAFKNSSFLVCRPFLSLESKAFFQTGLKFTDLDLRDYRVNFPHHLINPSPLYTARQEFEELSNIPIAYQVPYYGGVNSQSTGREVAFLRGMLGAGPSEIGLAADSKDDRFLDLVGAKYDLRFDNMEVRASALSRFMIFFDHEVIGRDEKILERLRDEDFDPLTTLIVSGDAGIPSAELTPAKKVDYVSRSEDEILLDLVVPKDSLLLFNDTFDNGWKASIDGFGVPVYRANFKFMAIAVPSGHHNIRFLFDPPVMCTIKSLTWAGITLFIFTIIILWRTRTNFKSIGMFLIIAMSGPSFFMGMGYLEKRSVLSLEHKNERMGNGCESKYFGYRVVCRDDVFYAIPQTLGLLDLMDVKNRKLPGILIGKCREEVRKLIDEAVAEKRQKLSVKVSVKAPKPISPPMLVTDHKNFNIVYYNNIFYSVPQSLGPLDLANDQDRARPEILVGGSWEEAEKLIDKGVVAGAQKLAGQTVAKAPTPTGAPILVTDHRGYNIVFYGDIFYGVPQSLGPTDLSDEANRTRPEIATGSNIKKAKKNIDKAINEKVFAHLRQTLLVALYSFLLWLNKG